MWLTTRFLTATAGGSRCGRPRPGRSRVRGALMNSPGSCAPGGKWTTRTEAEFAFVTDASLNDSGRRLHDLIKDMRCSRMRRCCAGPRRAWPWRVQLPSLDVLRRVRILTRMGTTETILAKVEMRILTLLSGRAWRRRKTRRTLSMRLLRRLFVIGGNIDLKRRTISRAEVLAALGLMRRACGAARPGRRKPLRPTALPSRRTAAGQRDSCPLNVVPVASAPRVLRLLDGPGAVPGRAEPGRRAGGDRRRRWWGRPERESQRP